MILSIAHRGASGYEPENTLLAFKKAIELDSDIIELDVQLTKDKQVVVSHDRKVWNRYAYVDLSKTTINNVRKIRLPKNQKILTLSQTLDIIQKKAVVNIEIKEPKATDYTYKIILYYILKKRCSYDDFIISSFNKNVLLKLKKLNSKIRVALLYKRIPRNINSIAEHYRPYSVNVHFTAIKKNFVKNMHEKGIKVFVWTVNSRKLIDKLRNYNVDGIFSDYPDRI